MLNNSISLSIDASGKELIEKNARLFDLSLNNMDLHEYMCSCAKFLTQILIFFDTNFSAFSGSILRKLICIFCVKINKNLYIKQHIFYNYFRYRNRQ